MSLLSGMAAVVEGWPISCTIEANPILHVARNGTTGELFFNTNNSASIGNGSYILVNRTNEENTTLDLTMDFRECTCGTSKKRYFCPGQASICTIASKDAPPTCSYIVSSDVFGVPPVPCLEAWIFMCFLVLVLSGQGRILLDFSIRTIFPKYNVVLANRMLARRREKAIAMIRAHMERRQRALHRHRYGIRRNQTWTAPMNIANNPVSLSLKTRKFYYNHQEQDDECEQTECTICFVAIENGDRVGELPCQHLFHIDCLKTWLRQRNVCPLCLAENIATPQYEQP